MEQHNYYIQIKYYYYNFQMKLNQFYKKRILYKKKYKEIEKTGQYLSIKLVSVAAS